MLEFLRVGAQRDVPQQWVAVMEKILATGEPGELFRRQGTVVATWRKRRGWTLGPYYRLVYRQGGRRHSIYLGRSAALAREVRALLASLQRTTREEREWERLRRAVKSALRARKAEWARELAKHGFWLKGYEVRKSHAGDLRSAEWRGRETSPQQGATTRRTSRSFQLTRSGGTP